LFPDHIRFRFQRAESRITLSRKVLGLHVKIDPFSLSRSFISSFFILILIPHPFFFAAAGRAPE
jgi:hypothetical protein